MISPARSGRRIGSGWSRWRWRGEGWLAGEKTDDLVLSLSISRKAEVAVNTLIDCRIIQLPINADPQGNLTYIESAQHIPFEIKRVFYLYDVPGGATRAGHALLTCHQFLIAMSGSFDVMLDDGSEKKRYQLNRSYYGLYIPPMIWREIDNFSSGSVCLAIASELFNEDGYIRDYSEYVTAIRNR